MIIKLELDLQEVNAILQVLGELPTKSNAYPLLKKIEEQTIPQIPKEESKSE